jgi:hypothetical protein
MGRVERARGFAIVISEKSNRGDKYHVNTTEVSGLCTAGSLETRSQGGCSSPFRAKLPAPIRGASERPGVGSHLLGLWNSGGGIGRGKRGPDHRAKQAVTNRSGLVPPASIRIDVLISRVLNRMQRPIDGCMLRGEADHEAIPLGRYRRLQHRVCSSFCVTRSTRMDCCSNAR